MLLFEAPPSVGGTVCPDPFIIEFGKQKKKDAHLLSCLTQPWFRSPMQKENKPSNMCAFNIGLEVR